MKAFIAIPMLLASLTPFSTYAAPGDGYGDNGSNRQYAGDRYDRRHSRCERCGVVDRIEAYRGNGHTSGGGAVAGAIIGGALGNQVGNGDGRKAATVIGAVAGGVAGNRIERNSRHSTRYDIHVRLDNGRRIVLTQRDLNGVREGSRVIVNNERVRLL